MEKKKENTRNIIEKCWFHQTQNPYSLGLGWFSDDPITTTTKRKQLSTSLVSSSPISSFFINDSLETSILLYLSLKPTLNNLTYILLIEKASKFTSATSPSSFTSYFTSAVPHSFFSPTAWYSVAITSLLDSVILFILNNGPSEYKSRGEKNLQKKIE